MDASNTPKKPLPGVVVNEILRRAAAENEPPTFPKVDMAYVEPPNVAKLRERVDAVATSRAGFTSIITLSEVAAEYQALCKDLLKRVEVLTMALMPFATHGLMMANMQMCLTGAGRTSEPAGGTWLNGLQQAQMQANSTIFYVAADAVGRAAVEERVMAIFEAMRKANEAMADRDAHVADKTLQGPIGGAIGGRSH